MWTVLFTLLMLSISQTNGVDPMVLTKQGLVRGTRSSDGRYSSFLGIPFATVDPENPFGESLPGPIFDTVFEAHDDSSICPQEGRDTIEGSLDCLRINIFVPSSASSTNRLPVMVWIYGGGFQGGSKSQSMQGPQYLIRHDVILVTLNYRVGLYGFMCLDIPSVPGNTGLKDQRTALRWVNENIAAFGGDINSITIFGQSAGGMSVELQTLSPGSNGLFHRAIIQSGSALVEGIVVHSRPSAPMEIVKHLGVEVQSTEDALDIMKTMPIEVVIKASSDLGLVFKPCIEKSFEGVNHFMVTYPDITLGSGQYESIPLIIGYNSHEQLGRYLGNQNNAAYFDQIQAIFYERINGSFAFQSEKQLENAAQIIQQFYIGNEPISKDVLYELGDFDSDAHFAHPIDRSLQYRLANSDKSLYQYVFAYTGGLNQMNFRNDMIKLGAGHGDEMPYVFKPDNTPGEISPEDLLMIDWMTTMWTNFAKHGDPTPETSELLPERWPAVTQESRDYLDINNNLVVDQKPIHDRIAFWDLFFVSFGEYYRMVWEAMNF